MQIEIGTVSKVFGVQTRVYGIGLQPLGLWFIIRYLRTGHYLNCKSTPMVVM